MPKKQREFGYNSTKKKPAIFSGLPPGPFLNDTTTAFGHK